MKTTLLITLLASIGSGLFGAESQQADVVVVAATPGGVATAVAAARSRGRRGQTLQPFVE